MTLKLHTIICSTRPGRIGPSVGKWAHEQAVQNGSFDAELVDLADFNLPVFDEPHHPRLQKYEHEHTKKWSASVGAADAFVFVIPEYDYFPPSSLVNAIQFLVIEWAYKPAAFVSYGGISGGLRAVQTTKLLISALRVMPIPESVPIPLVGKMLDANKVLTPTDEVTAGAKLMLGELAKWATALKTMR